MVCRLRRLLPHSADAACSCTALSLVFYAALLRACSYACVSPRLPSLPYSEVLEGANELRIMLCRPKETSGERSSTSIVAACGIYMKVGAPLWGCAESGGAGLAPSQSLSWEG